MAVNYPEHISLIEANKILADAFESYCKSLKSDEEISHALGMTLTADIKAARNVPHYAASAVDGYAIYAAATAGASPASPVRIEAGKWQWMNTGAALPMWADCVLMIEDSSLDGDTLIVYKTLTTSSNVRPLGEDVMAGQIIAREDQPVTPALISLFLCAGIERIPVRRKARCLFIPTGDEIVSREEWLARREQASGTSAESNSLFIAASLQKWGFTADKTPVLPDNPQILREYIQKGTHDYDIVLVGAGSAKGKRDHTAEVFSELGQILFRGVRMKPGRPAMAAKINGKPVLCMPGFPMSTTVALWSLVYPLLMMLSGKKENLGDMIYDAIGAKSTLNAKLLIQHSSPAGIEDWLRMKAAQVGDKIFAWPLTSGASVLWALAESDGITLLPPSALECERGTDISLMMTRRVDFAKRLFFQGSDDPAVQLLATPVKRRGAEFICRAVGSMGGLAALSRGECHIAAAHLLDGDSGKYNDSFIEKFSAGRKWVRYLLFYRTQGIIVRRGNPLGIKDFADMCAKGAVIANRQPGAGTRVLLDYLLVKHGISPDNVKGYSQICTTHMEVSNRVLTGLADAALGIKSAADALDLDFIPITEEPYELVYPEEYAQHPGIIALLESVKEPLWRERVKEMGGYRFPD